MVVLPVPSALGRTSVCSLSLIWMMSPCSGHGFSARHREEEEGGAEGSELPVLCNLILIQWAAIQLIAINHLAPLCVTNKPSALYSSVLRRKKINFLLSLINNKIVTVNWK